jgi:hypothetical protein
MRSLPEKPELLKILNEAQPERPWKSCQEKRSCVVCERTFRGTDVIINSHRLGVIRLACPSCGSDPGLWVRLGNPLLDDLAWADWESALEIAASRFSGESDCDLAAIG